MSSGSGARRESGVHAYEDLIEKSSRRIRTGSNTASNDPALIIYTSGTTGQPKGALEAHRLILGNIPGFVYSHDFFPQPGDMFWSPADWAWAGGLMDALLPSWYFGMPILGYRGRFDAGTRVPPAGKVRRAELVSLSDGPEADDEGRSRAEIPVRPLPALRHERGRVGRRHRDRMGARAARRHHQRDVRPDRDQLRGRQLPGGLAGQARLHRPAVSRATKSRSSTKKAPKFRAASWAKSRSGRTTTRCSSSSTGRIPQATREKFIGDWGCTGDQGRMDEDGYLWYQGRSDDVIKSSGYRIGPAEIESCLVKHPGGRERGGDRQARRGARPDRQGVHRAAAGPRGRRRR